MPLPQALPPATWPAPVPGAAAAVTPRFQEKREAILDAAARAFNAQGVKGATLGAIAAEVGLVTTSITYYYRRKEDLATACFGRAIDAHRALAERALAEGGASVAERVTRYLLLHAELLAAIDEARHPALILFNDIRALPDALASAVFDAYTDMFRGVRALLAGPQTAALGRDALNARAHLLLSMAHWTRGWIGRHETDEYPRVARRVADVVLHGLAGAGRAWPGDQADAGLPPPPADDGGDAFLRAATELVNEQGYRGASVEKISARLHVTKGSFYHHHDTKLDLITACFERSFAVLRHTLKAAEQAEGSGWARACAAAVALVRFQLSGRGPLLRSSATSALPDQDHRAGVHRTMQRLTERIAGVLVDGLVDGSVRPQDPAIAAQWLSATINAAAELRRWVPGVDVDNVTRLYTRPALMGLLSAE